MMVTVAYVIVLWCAVSFPTGVVVGRRLARRNGAL